MAVAKYDHEAFATALRARKGRILIDGYDLAKLQLGSVRSQIGIVPQDSLLFEGSVRDNIALTAPDATSEEIEAAARAVCAHEFIMELLRVTRASW